MEPPRALVEPGEEVGARAEEAKQIEVTGRVVVSVPQRRELLVDRAVRADDERERRFFRRRGGCDLARREEHAHDDHRPYEDETPPCHRSHHSSILNRSVSWWVPKPEKSSGPFSRYDSTLGPPRGSVITAWSSNVGPSNGCAIASGQLVPDTVAGQGNGRRVLGSSGSTQDGTKNARRRASTPKTSK